MEEYRRDQARLEAVLEERRRNEAALQARYDAIGKAWDESGLPVFVRRTPDWEDGWRVLLAWLEPHYIRMVGRAWRHETDLSPLLEARWRQEIHVYSHMYDGSPSGHHAAHAAVEEEGAQAILAWWTRARAGG